MKPLVASLAVSLLLLSQALPHASLVEAQILQPALPSLDQLASALTTLIRSGNTVEATKIFEGILTGIVELIPITQNFDGIYEANLLVQAADMEIDRVNMLTGNVLANIIFVLNNSVGSGSTNEGELAAQLTASVIDGIRRKGLPDHSLVQSLENLYGVGNLLTPSAK